MSSKKDGYVNESNALWVKLINVIYGAQIGVHFGGSRFHDLGVWARIFMPISTMHEKEFVKHDTISRCVGRGDQTKFWFDIWVG